jgi:predicted nucleotidyltransferase component of viral defense system
MKTISKEQARTIDDVTAESVMTLSPAILEKDALVTEALRAISQIELPGLTLTFSGGTCLAKAYGLLERMSEDIDLRLAVKDRDTLTRSALRRVLRDVKTSLADALRAAEFGIPNDAIKARNENQFISFDIDYRSHYQTEASLRPSIRVEFMAIAPRCTTVRRRILPLIDEITGRSTVQPVELACLAIEETYCEKIISYLRRATEHLSNRNPSQYEERLARHIYDVYRIVTVHYREADQPSPLELFRAILTAEVEQYGHRDAAFHADAASTLQKTLHKIGAHPEFRDHYERFAANLLYGTHRPSFLEAYEIFRKAGTRLLDS